MRQYKDGLVIITAVMNRPEPLRYAIPSWLDTPASQIIIVDWGSDQPILDVLPTMDIAGYPNDRITIVRVDAQFWQLCEAYNLALHFVQFDRLLKLDADVVVVEPELLALEDNSFLFNPWQHARRANLAYLTGSFMAWTKDIVAVNGYDRRFDGSYGYDDDDLYHRLERSGIKRTRMADNALYHLPHSDSKRFENYENTEPGIDTAKKIFLSNRTPWVDEKRTEWSYSKRSKNYWEAVR